MGCSASSHELPPLTDVSLAANSHVRTPHVERSLPPSLTKSITSSTTPGGCDDFSPLLVVSSTATRESPRHTVPRHPAAAAPAAVIVMVDVIPVLSLLSLTEGTTTTAAGGAASRGAEPVSYSMEVSNLQLLASIGAQASGGSVGQYSVSDAPLVEVAYLSDGEVW